MEFLLVVRFLPGFSKILPGFWSMEWVTLPLKPRPASSPRKTGSGLWISVRSGSATPAALSTHSRTQRGRERRLEAGKKVNFLWASASVTKKF